VSLISCDIDGVTPKPMQNNVIKSNLIYIL
jgi:hypothetical protein